jgi:hypothetical protein
METARIFFIDLATVSYLPLHQHRSFPSAPPFTPSFIFSGPSGDIMVALKAHPELPLESAIRAMHPFPIFERYVSHDIILPSSSHRPASSEKKERPHQKDQQQQVIAVKGNTQVIMFTSDFLISNNSNYSWNIFGAGDRICSGMHYALPYLRILFQSFHPLILPSSSSSSSAPSSSSTGEEEKDNRAKTTAKKTRTEVSFEPELHHRYSGRNNDGKSSVAEFFYLISLVIGIFYFKISQRIFQKVR